MEKFNKDEVLNKTRDDLRAKDNSPLKVNGFETTVAEYYQNPQGFNTAPMDKKFIEKMEQEHKEAVEAKRRLSINPHAIKALDL